MMQYVLFRAKYRIRFKVGVPNLCHAGHEATTTLEKRKIPYNLNITIK